MDFLGNLIDNKEFPKDLEFVGKIIQDICFNNAVRYFKIDIDDILIIHDDLDLDGLNYLEGKDLAFVNQKAFEGTLKAHVEDGNVPCAVIYVDKMNEKNLGHLFYFFMRACAMSAYLLVFELSSASAFGLAKPVAGSYSIPCCS